MMIAKEFKEKLKNQKEYFVAARTSKLQRDKAEQILEKIKEECKLEDTTEALAVVAILFQQGGTARSCDSNLSITFFNKEFKLAMIRKVLKQQSCNRAERKLARTLADEIQEIAAIMEVPGNLYAKIQKIDFEKNFTIEEKAWLSDFQSDNENCPAELRKLILDTFKKNENETTKKK